VVVTNHTGSDVEAGSGATSGENGVGVTRGALVSDCGAGVVSAFTVDPVTVTSLQP